MIRYYVHEIMLFCVNTGLCGFILPDCQFLILVTYIVVVFTCFKYMV
jgi:hypothetical protein